MRAFLYYVKINFTDQGITSGGPASLDKKSWRTETLTRFLSPNISDCSDKQFAIYFVIPPEFNPLKSGVGICFLNK
jgi:hypothetical protein